MFKDPAFFIGKKTSGSLCVLCKGSKLLCGKDRCPLMLKFYSHAKTKRLIDGIDLFGDSPPGVFVGRYGYPKVDIGPLVPPLSGDTSIMDTPELWVGKTIEEIVDFRFSLVRGKYKIDVADISSPSRIVDQTRELALAINPIGVEAKFEKPPSGRIVLDDEVQPFGPSGKLKKLSIEYPKFDQKIEKAYYDTDLRAVEAVVGLYQQGVMISRIQKAFSVGAFGIERNRRFVPTRWSITAVDDLIGKALLKKTKTYPLIDEFRIYDWEQLDNRWIVLLLPTTWRYELIEAWYPNTAWNPSGKQIEIISDHEFYNGRKEYAQIGGCYYAARLAVNELLERERRQAGAVIFREAHPGYIMPVGVWNVRENVRMALNQRPFRFSRLEDALRYISSRMDIPIDVWIKHSEILRDTLHQRRIEEYV
ncbi:MAG: Nre family DNA repair protein [Methanomassiliicoccales archaeon]|nr:Nre family DNA repair protein [Methanomassiliicoccales archaeon]